MSTQPPKRALKFLRWFCREDYLEEFEGDLIELFEKQYESSPAKAKLKFFWGVLRCFRPSFIRSFKIFKNSNTFFMFKTHYKIAWRNLIRQPFFTMLNTLGLSVGMAGALLIGLYIHYELSYDKMFADADRIYRANIDNRTSGERSIYASVSGPLANVLREDFPHAEMVTRFQHIDGMLIKSAEADENVKEEKMVAVDETFFAMFGIPLLSGNEATALKEKNSIVLTEEAAQKHFAPNEALGKELVLNNDETYLVTGVIEELPNNSFLANHSAFISLSSLEGADSPAWNNWNFPTFVKLSSSDHEADLQSFLSGVTENYLVPWAMQFVPGLTLENWREQQEISGNYLSFNAIALTDIHLHSPNMKGEFNLNGDLKDIYILSFIGSFLLLLACVNFMNLATAKSLKRSKEVGIRKTLGSKRGNLISQFLTESSLVVFLSMLVALMLVGLVLPHFNQFSGKLIVMPWGSLTFWLLMMVCTLVLGIVAGSYPALMLSRFSPLKSLRNASEGSAENGRIRNSLVVFQFIISVFLIASTLVVYEQLKYIQNKDLGFEKEQVLVLNNVDALKEKSKTLKEEVLRISAVKNVSVSSFLPTPSDRNGTTFFKKEDMSPESAIIIGNWRVDHDYIETLGLELLAGRSFDKRLATDSSALILNESAVKLLGLSPEQAIGLELTDDFKRPDQEDMRLITVIGVIKNFHFESMRNSIDAMSLKLGSDAQRMMVKFAPSDFNESIARIERLWDEIAPGQPFEYYFMDDAFNSVYEAENKLGRIFMLFTILSVIVACLGLFGLAAFNAEKRAKEIGIRKVLGAGVLHLTSSLTLDFLKLVGLAILVSLPLAGYFMNLWLNDFSYRVSIPWWIYLVSALLAIGISIVTVSFQSAKAAMSNPVNALKSG